MFNHSEGIEETNQTDSTNSPTGLNPNPILRLGIITAIFLIGTTGNAAALWILNKSAKTRNRKHVLLLRCLTTNDLVAQVGMFLLLSSEKLELLPKRWICTGYVLLRAFGIGSGCVALVMALERWLALTRPFLYQQLVTYRVLKRFVFCVWGTGALLTYLPLFGFGLYFNKEEHLCYRYREATETLDVVYAYMFLLFGTCLCVCITVFNVTVICELSRIRSHGRTLVRRVSRSIINNRVGGCSKPRYQTPEEVAFAKLMAAICIIFTACWAPQLISIPFGRRCRYMRLCKMADVLMGIYFTLDPYVYVLQRYIERGKLLPCCFHRRSTNSLTTTTTTTTTGTPTSVLLLQPPVYPSPTVM